MQTGGSMRFIQRATRTLSATAACLALTASLLSAQAQNEVPRGDGEQVARPKAAVEAIAQLKSPYCPTMLEVCSSSQGAALRDSLVQFAEQGWTTEQLVEWVIGNHGEKYRALPRKEGRALVAWIVPPLGVALGIVALTFALKGMMRSSSEPRLATEAISPEEEQRLRAAMQELDREEEATFF